MASPGMHLSTKARLKQWKKIWKGPISDFRLIIKKDSADQLVSLCFPGQPKKIGNSIVFSIRDFVPADDLVVYFISGF